MFTSTVVPCWSITKDWAVGWHGHPVPGGTPKPPQRVAHGHPVPTSTTEPRLCRRDLNAFWVWFSGGISLLFLREHLFWRRFRGLYSESLFVLLDSVYQHWRLFYFDSMINSSLLLPPFSHDIDFYGFSCSSLFIELVFEIVAFNMVVS